MQSTAPNMGLALCLRRCNALRAASGKRFATLRVAGLTLERGYKASRDKGLGAVPLFTSGVGVGRADERDGSRAFMWLYRLVCAHWAPCCSSVGGLVGSCSWTASSLRRRPAMETKKLKLFACNFEGRTRRRESATVKFRHRRVEIQRCRP